MATYTTHTPAIGQAENVQDVIYNIGFKETPFFTAIKKGNATATLHQWQMDDFRAAADNAQAEGAAVGPTDATAVATIMLDNACQIFREVASVSRTLDTVRKYGRRREMAYQVTKKMVEVKKDIEFACVGTLVSQDKATTDPRHMSSAAFQINAGGNAVAGGALGTLTEANILAAHELAYADGGEPSMLLTNQAYAEQIAAFALSAGNTRDFGMNKTYVNAVDLLVTPYGELTVVLDRICDDDHVFLVDPDYMQYCALQNTRQTALGKRGDSTEVLIVNEGTLACLNPNAHAVITGIDAP